MLLSPHPNLFSIFIRMSLEMFSCIEAPSTMYVVNMFSTYEFMYLTELFGFKFDKDWIEWIVASSSRKIEFSIHISVSSIKRLIRIRLNYCFKLIPKERIGKDDAKCLWIKLQIFVSSDLFNYFKEWKNNNYSIGK